jgi:hypothetical protein
MTPDGFQERRRHPRLQTQVPLELHYPGSSAPLRATASEISLTGCYIETMFTLPAGTKLEMVLWVGGEKLLANGVIATCYPQVGNGIDITEMTAEDRAKLGDFLAKSQH